MPNHKHDAACFEDETKIYRRMHVRSFKFQNDEEISIEYSLYVKFFESINNQNYSNYRLFMVDDASTDDTSNVIKKKVL